VSAEWDLICLGQHVEAFQRVLEVGNSLRSGVDDTPEDGGVFSIGINSARSKFPASVPLPTLFSFQRTVYRI
jgi:hypothetical protein